MVALPTSDVAREAVVMPASWREAVSTRTRTMVGSMPVSWHSVCTAMVWTPCPISVQPWSSTTRSGASMVILTWEASAMPLPTPVFLMPQASPAYLAA